MPTIAPTNALTTTSSENCPRFSRSPRRIPLTRALRAARRPGPRGAHDSPAARPPVGDAVLHAVGGEAPARSNSTASTAITQYGPRQ